MQSRGGSRREGDRPTGNSDATTLTEALGAAATAPSAGVRFLDSREEGRWLAWSELLARANRTAGGLEERGIKRGERVALVFPTGEEFLVAFFATLLAGAIPAPVYPPLRLGRLEEYYERTSAMWRAVDATLVLADARARRLLGPALERARPRRGCYGVEEIVGAEPTSRPPLPTDIALVQFSSGTTRVPRPVALSHRAIMAQVHAFNGLFPDSPGLRHSGVSWLPLYHDMGLIGTVLGAVARGAELTLVPPELFLARPALWLRAISRYRATVSPAPNFAYGLAAEKIRDEELQGVDLSCWRLALNGAEPVVASTLTSFAERFSSYGFDPRALTPVYGLAEAALAVTFSAIGAPCTTRRFERVSLGVGQTVAIATNDEKASELVSLGRPLPGFALSLRDDAGREIGEERVGRLWVRGPSLMNEYLGLPTETSRVLVDGWLDTGDEGFLWQGELYLTGRAKETIIRHGRNFPPAEIELLAGSIAGARSGCAAAVVCRRDDGSEEAILLIERRRGAARLARGLEEEILNVVRSRLGLELDRVVVLDPGTLPRTSSGKIRRREALERWLGGTLAPPKRLGRLKLARVLARSRRALSRFQQGRHDDAP